MGSSGSSRIDAIARETGEADPRPAVSLPADAGAPGRPRQIAERVPQPGRLAAPRQRPRRSRPPAAPGSFCTPLTTGSVSISARPIARHHVADVRRAPAQRQQRQRGQRADRAPPATRTAGAPSPRPGRPAGAARSQSRSSRTSLSFRALSIAFRMSRSSSADARLLASACSTSFDDDPANARSTRSRTSCRCVCLFAEPRAIDVGAVPLVALDEPFFRHDLEQLQRGGVGRLALAAQDFVDLPDRAGPAIPQDPQDGQLGIGRPGAGVRFMGRVSTTTFVVSTKIFVGIRVG